METRHDFVRKLPSRIVGTLLAVIAGDAVLTACANAKPSGVSKNVTPPLEPTATKKPDHIPLPIVEQFIDTPVTIPRGKWLYDSTIADSGSLEFAYQRESGKLYTQATGWGVMITHADKIVVFTNKLAYDHRSDFEGLPEFWPEDRWVWASEQNINDFVVSNRLEMNKNVVMVEAQTYPITNGAGWELAAFGGGVKPQRWTKTSAEDTFVQLKP